MPLDPNISLSYQPPQIQNPLQTIGQVQALKNQQLAGQMSQLELQQNQLNMQQQQQAIQAFKDSGGDWDKAINTMYSQGNLLAPKYVQSQAELQKIINDNRAAVDKHNADRASRLSNIAAGVMAASPDTRGIAYAHGRTDVVGMFPELDKVLPPTYTPDMDPQIETWANAGQTAEQRAQTKKATAEAAGAEAKKPGEEAQSKILQAKYDVYNRLRDQLATNPNAADQMIDGIFPASLDPQINTSLKNALKSAVTAGGPDAVEDIIKQATTHAASFVQSRPGWNAFLADYQRRNPGATVEQAMERYKQLQPVPQQLMITPLPGGGGRADLIRPGQIVQPGAVTASTYSGIQVPSTVTRTMIQSAPGVIKLANKLESEIRHQQETLGPGISRWNDIWTNKVGAPNPEFKQLTVDADLLQTLLMKMHTGRGSDFLLKRFTDMINTGKDSPENLLAALNSIRSYAQDVEKTPSIAEIQSGAGAGGGTAAPNVTHTWNPDTGIQPVK